MGPRSYSLTPYGMTLPPPLRSPRSPAVSIACCRSSFPFKWRIPNALLTYVRLGQQYVNQYEALKLGVNSGSDEEEQPEQAIRRRTLRQEALSSFEEAYGMAKEHLDTASGKERALFLSLRQKERRNDLS